MLDTIFEGQQLILIRIISKLANAFGMKIYLIGGCVRDLLLDKKPKDIDIVVEGNVFSLANSLQEKTMCRIIKSQKDLRTIRLDFGNGIEIDFASTRSEIYGDKKGIPIVSSFGCSLKEDVLRRDFSVNALAISLNPTDFGKVVDYVKVENPNFKEEIEEEEV